MPRLSSQQQLVCSLAIARVVLASLRPGEAVEDAIKRIRRSFILHAAGLTFTVEEGRDSLKSKIQELEQEVKLRELELSKAKKIQDALLAETEALKASTANEASAATKLNPPLEPSKDKDTPKESEKGKEKAKKGAAGAGGKKKAAAAGKDVSTASTTANISTATNASASVSRIAEASKNTAKNQSTTVQIGEQSSQASSSSAPVSKDKKTTKKATAAFHAAQNITLKPEVILLESFITKYGGVGLKAVLGDDGKTAQHAFDGLKTIYELKHLHSSLNQNYGTEAMLYTIKEKALLLLRSAKEGLLQLSLSTKENMPPFPISETKTNLTAAQKRKAAAAALQAFSNQKDKSDVMADFASCLKDRMKSLACFILEVLGLVCQIVDDEKWSIGKEVDQAKAEMVCMISSEIGEILHLLISFFPIATEYVYRTLLAPLPKQAVDALSIYNLAGPSAAMTATSKNDAPQEGSIGSVEKVDIRTIINSLILSICNLDKMKSYVQVKKKLTSIPPLYHGEASVAASLSSMALWRTRYGLLKAIHGSLKSQGRELISSNEGANTQKKLVKSKSGRLEQIMREICSRETVLGLAGLLDSISDMDTSPTSNTDGKSRNTCSEALNRHQRRELSKILQDCEDYINTSGQTEGDNDAMMEILMHTLSKVASSFGSQLLEDIMINLH